MRKRGLAIWPLATFQPEVTAQVVVKVETPEKWDQETESFLNERREWRRAQENLQRLIPGFDVKKLVL